MANAIEILKSAATVVATGGKNPLDIFYSKIDAQIAYVKDVAEGKTVSSRSLWFRRDGTSYVVRIGRNGFEIAGSKLLRAEDLEGVKVILGAAKQAIQADKALQDKIALHALERSERHKAGRLKKSKK